jgi:hypothetical protein
LRKGEDFGGFLIQVVEALDIGPEAIEMLHQSYQSFCDLSDICIQRVIKLDWKEIVAWYLAISKSWEIGEKQFKRLKEIILPPRKRPKKPDLRLLCYPDKRNELARVGWEALGYQVRHYRKKADKGSHRLYISDKEYALFYRAPDDSFFGLTGKDKKTIGRMKTLFEIEWAKAKTPRPILSSSI